MQEAKRLDLMSDEHFTVDGTLLEACASLKSFKKVDGGEEPPVDDPGNPTVDYHGEKRSNDARLQHGCGCHAGPEGVGQRSEAEL